VKYIKVVDLFSGTRSIAKAFQAHNHETYTIELDKRHDNIDWYADIMDIEAEDIIERFGHPDVIWASPPCTTYSIAAISHHRNKDANGNLSPKSEFAKQSDELVKHTIALIAELKPKYWFIENPRGGLRKMDFMQPFNRYTITYCQYGDNRMKPTDIWTNHPNPLFKPPCKNGDSCHVSAPRGAKTGTQGLKGAVERSIIPAQLCEHIVEICEDP
jgi:site-specific DNA-cytosine methylase